MPFLQRPCPIEGAARLRQSDRQIFRQHGIQICTTKERVGRVDQRRQVVIPREIFDTLCMRAGDADALTPDEARRVRRGEAQLKRGVSKPWGAVKNAGSR